MSASIPVQPDQKRSKLIVLLPVVVFAVVGSVFLWGLQYANDRLPSPLLGQSIPEFTLPPINGMKNGLSSANLRGEVSIVNVWASWCVPCRIEMPLLNEIAANGTVTIYGINYKDDPERAKAFLLELGDPYKQIGADRAGRVAIDWGVYGLPETFVIDADGRIAHKHVGPFDRQSLEEKILPIVKRLKAGGDP